MKTYELTYIISSEINSPEADALPKEIEKAIQGKEGVILRSEKTVAQVLAYPMKGKSSGYFGTIDLQIAENKIKEIKELLQKDKRILRHLILIKKPFREMKERRMRKPEFAMTGSGAQSQSPFKHEEKKQEQVNPEDLDKKLGEILGE
ncbi:MAG: 30S ribosomal protein S6 [Patescibacteria group bacterium]